MNHAYLYRLVGIVLLIVSSGRLTAQSTPAGRYVNLAHLNHLYQTVTLPNSATVGTVAIYSNAPDYRLVGDDDEGFTCIDDVARAALFLLNEPDLTTSPSKQTRLRAMTEFVLQLQAPEGAAGAGYFYNFLWPDRTINKTFRTSVAEANFWSWRAFWCLSEANSYYRQRDVKLAGRIAVATQKITANVLRDFGGKPAEYDTIQSVAVPKWLPFGSGTDQAAILLICLANEQQRQASADVLKLIEKLGDGIVAMQHGGQNQFPYGAILSFENTWHAYASDQAYALLRVGRQLNKPDWQAAARREIDNFYPWLIRQNYLESFDVQQTGDAITSIRMSQFSQIAYGIRPMIWATLEAYDQTNDQKYTALARRLASWFLGKNIASTPMYDKTTGRGYDGIGANGVNRNAGAESTIESLWAFQRLEKYKIL
ncbi:hypothetical protein [Spirosoma rhododendri]|uniref:Uncharacterized protein n=1 Tax=Spirosoma rhododendri TaxID=2728024 RepID=A0A7L5DJB6_9BACT|nr:hypothetical protein [Spirosoma rhododendri]QJD77521.1 hypothetical protein HH216_03140 [Spirosoma rhododendri]